MKDFQFLANLARANSWVIIGTVRRDALTKGELLQLERLLKLRAGSGAGSIETALTEVERALDIREKVRRRRGR